MPSAKSLHPFEALHRVSHALGFDMQFDEATGSYCFLYVASGQRLQTTWAPPWRHNHATKTITCQHGISWGQAAPIGCAACLDPGGTESEDLTFAQIALTAVEEMWAIATTGVTRPLVS